MAFDAFLEHELSAVFNLTQLLNVDPNETSATAKALSSGEYAITSRGEDWFVFDANPGTINLLMTPTSGTDVNMILHNSLLQVVAANFVANGTETINFNAASGGRFFLKIFPTTSQGSSYTLSLGLPANTFARTLDFGPIRDSSVALFDIDLDGKDEIFVGTSKALDAGLNEVRPAGLICLEDNGTIKWALSFPAITGPDSQTGKVYNTTSVSTAPSFSDLDGDGNYEIIVGVGADVFGQAPGVVGQPGDKGGVYAVNANGTIKWFHQSRDDIGGSTNNGDGRPDGVFGSPVVFDIDRDGVKEVIYNSWDRNTWILDGRTGTEERRIHLADTVWSTPRIADLNGDNIFEILVSADISANAQAGTSTGGIFHVLSADGTQNIPGFNQPVGNPGFTELRGKAEEQTLWSSPVTADIDHDGFLEILYGTGNFFPDTRGSYIRVWEHDGTLKFTLPTNGRTFATPLVADLDADGDLEIVATTLNGVVHGWDHLGSPIFTTNSLVFLNSAGNPIFSSPIAVDLNGDNKLEIIYSQGAQLVILDSRGQLITNPSQPQFINNFFRGSPAAADIDNDGLVDIISGGTTSTKDQAVVYRFSSPLQGTVTDLTAGRFQFSQGAVNADHFVTRFYEKILGRTPDTAGLMGWVDQLTTGVSAGADIARGFIFSQEFSNQGLNNSTYVDVLYKAFFNRDPDAGGKTGWLNMLNNGASRAAVLDGFILSQEFKNLALSFSILPVK